MRRGSRECVHGIGLGGLHVDVLSSCHPPYCPHLVRVFVEVCDGVIPEKDRDPPPQGSGDGGDKVQFEVAGFTVCLLDVGDQSV